MEISIAMSDMPASASETPIAASQTPTAESCTPTSESRTPASDSGPQSFRVETRMSHSCMPTSGFGSGGICGSEPGGRIRDTDVGVANRAIEVGNTGVGVRNPDAWPFGMPTPDAEQHRSEFKTPTIALEQPTPAV